MTKKEKLLKTKLKEEYFRCDCAGHLLSLSSYHFNEEAEPDIYLSMFSFGHNTETKNTLSKDIQENIRMYLLCLLQTIKGSQKDKEFPEYQEVPEINASEITDTKLHYLYHTITSILESGHPYADSVILNKKTAMRLSKALNKFANSKTIR